MPTSHLRAPFPAELPVIRAPLMGRQCRERHKGLRLKQPELWLQPLCFPSRHNGNLGIFHWIGEKKKKKDEAFTRNRRKMYLEYLAARHSARESMHQRSRTHTHAHTCAVTAKCTVTTAHDLHLCVPYLSSLPATRLPIRSCKQGEIMEAAVDVLFRANTSTSKALISWHESLCQDTTFFS